MWYLLVAAGAGILAQRWQNMHKGQQLGVSEAQVVSSPPTAPGTPHGAFTSMNLSNDLDMIKHLPFTINGGIMKKDGSSVNPKASFAVGSTTEESPIDMKASFVMGSPKEGPSMDPKASFTDGSISKESPFDAKASFAIGSTKGGPYIEPKASFVVGSTIEESPIDVMASFVIGSTKDGPSIDPKATFVMGSTKSNLLDPMGYESMQGLAHDKGVSSPMKSNKRRAHEAFIGNQPMEGWANIDSAKIKTALEHGGEEPSSPSSCCSSSSTVVNSPLGDRGTIFQEQKGGFDASEHPEELQSYGGGGYAKPALVNKMEKYRVGFNESHAGTLSKRTPSSSCASVKDLENDGGGFRAPHVGTLSKRTPSSSACVSPCEKNSSMLSRAPQFSSTMPAVGLLPTNLNMIFSDASTRVPYLFTGKNQEGTTKTAFYGSNEFDSGSLESDEKHNMLELGTDTSTSKVKPLPQSHCVAAAENVADPESDSLLNFGLAMGVFLMVSSSKREMERMGKVLKETEDLVSDMRKELEERKAHSSCMSSRDACEGSARVLSAAKNKDRQKFARDDEESICSEDHVRMRNLEVELEAELRLINTYSQVGNSSLNLEDQYSHGYGSHEFRGDEGEVLSTLEQVGENDLVMPTNHKFSGDEGEVSSTSEQVGENDLVMSTIDLERKLWKIFQERQEEKIHELEEALELALSKLQAKDEELHWWKNRASWLMQRTLGSKIGENETGGEVRDKNSAGHCHGLVRVGSTCSLSSEDSVLSFDIRTFT